VEKYGLDLFPAPELDEGFKVALMAVHAAVPQKTHEMKPSASSFGCPQSIEKDLIG
jgi:hypothetical protein